MSGKIEQENRLKEKNGTSGYSMYGSNILVMLAKKEK